MVEKPFLKNLLVQPSAVKAGGKTQFDVAPEVLVAWRSHDAIGIVALIENQALE